MPTFDSELHIIVKKMFRFMFVIVLCMNLFLDVSGRRFFVKTKDVSPSDQVKVAHNETLIKKVFFRIVMIILLTTYDQKTKEENGAVSITCFGENPRFSIAG